MRLFFRFFWLILLCFAPVALAAEENAVETIEVWVPTRTIYADDVIAEADLQSVDMSEDDLPNNAVINPKDMIGMQAQRTLREGAVIRKNALAAPTLIQKKDIVTLSIETPQMKLTAQGQAMDDGAMGDMIRVMNLSSKKIISAIVTGKQTAKVIIATEEVPQ